MGSMTEHIQMNKFCHVLSPRFEQNVDLSAGEDGGRTLQFWWDGYYSSISVKKNSRLKEKYLPFKLNGFWFKLMYNIYLRKDCKYCCVSFTEGGRTLQIFSENSDYFSTHYCNFVTLISIK